MKKRIVIFLMLFFLFAVPNVKAEDVAEIDGTAYGSLAIAISKVSSSSQTTITLLVDRSENFTIPSGKNIILDLNNHTLSNNGNNTVINNNGTLEIINGTMTTDAKSGMINNNKGGILTINEGNYIATGLRQVIYNNEGTLYLGGTAYLESATSERATLHNLNNGKAYISGGTIISKAGYAVYNDKGTIDIGEYNEVYDKTTPVIQGATYGVIANNKVNIYDGVIRGGTYHLGTATSSTTPTVANDINETKIDKIEDYSEKRIESETIGETTYSTLTYDLDTSNIIKVTFDANGGNVDPQNIRLTIGESIGTLPTPTRINHRFDGWFTGITDGVQVTEETKPNTNVTYYAHWTFVDPNTVAYVEGIGYMSLENALAVGGNIRLEKDVIVDSSLEMFLPATLDLNGHTISLGNNTLYISEEVTIDDLSESKTGMITSNADFTVVVGDSAISTNAHLIHKGGTIEGLGKYGAIKNFETLEVDGGTVQGTATDTGFVVYNNKDFIMKSGTVYSTNGRAVQVGTNATFTMDGGLVKTDAEFDQALNLYGDCSATINGGTIEGMQPRSAGIAMFHNTTLVVNGGTIKGAAMAIAGNGSDSNSNANIIINGGDLSATDGVGIYLPQQDSTTIINGGNISGPTGIEIRAANLIINGGNIVGTADVYEVEPNNNGTTTKGVAIAVAQHITQKPIHVVINNGDFEAVVALCNVNPSNNLQSSLDLITIDVKQGEFVSTGDEAVDIADSIPIVPFISGGSYTNDPSTYVKEGYGVVKAAEDQYNVYKIYNIIIDSSNPDIVTIDKDKYPYTETVEYKIKDGLLGELTIEVKDIDGNNIEVNNNKFIMPENDVIITVTYEEVKGDDIVNPDTGDYLYSYINMLFMSLIGIIVSIILNKRLKDI